MVLVDEFLDPGSFTQLRFSMNLADINSSLIRNPECNVSLTDGTSRPIYYYDPTTSDLTIDQSFTIKSRVHTDLTFDFDVRKSLQFDSQGNYLFKPAIRVIETAKAGHLSATTINNNSAERLVVYAYPAGAFVDSEAGAPAAGDVRFSHSITSARVLHGNFGLGFLEAGTYDLIFVRQSETGDFLSMKGRLNGSVITAGQTLALNIDLSDLASL